MNSAKHTFGIKTLRISLIIIIIFLVLTGCGIGNSNYQSSSHEIQSASDAESSVENPEGFGFEVHFIDVGQGDAALVLYDHQAMLIDGGNVADSDLIYSYLKKHNVDYLDYVVCTHAHEDHVGGACWCI